MDLDFGVTRLNSIGQISRVRPKLLRLELNIPNIPRNTRYTIPLAMLTSPNLKQRWRCSKWPNQIAELKSITIIVETKLNHIKESRKTIM